MYLSMYSTDESIFAISFGVMEKAYKKGWRVRMDIMAMGAYTEDGERFYLPSMEINGLFIMDLSKGHQADLVGEFPDCVAENAWRIKSVICFNDKLYFFSHHAFEMWEMDKTERITKHYSYFDGSTGLIDIVLLANAKIWIVSRKPLRILCLDLDTKQAEQIHWKTESELQDNICSMSSKWEDRIYVCTRLEKEVYMGVIDCRNDSVIFRRLDELWIAKNITAWKERVYIFGISCDGAAVLMEYDINGTVMIACHRLDRIKLNKNTEIDYREIFVHRHKVFLIPGVVDQFMIYDLKDSSERSMTNLDMPILIEGTLPFLDIQKMENYLYLFPGVFRKIVKINLDTLQTEMIDVYVRDDDYKELVLQSPRQTYFENVNMNLRRFLEWMV